MDSKCFRLDHSHLTYTNTTLSAKALDKEWAIKAISKSIHNAFSKDVNTKVFNVVFSRLDNYQKDIKQNFIKIQNEHSWILKYQNAKLNAFTKMKSIVNAAEWAVISPLRE